jgi:hypothetical protein
VERPEVIVPDAKWGIWFADGTRPLLSDQKELLNFGFPALNGAPEGKINGTDVTVLVPANTDLKALIPGFSLSHGARALVNGVEQVSGSSKQDFSKEVRYTIEAQDLSTKTYRINVQTTSSLDARRMSHVSLQPNPVQHELTLIGIDQEVYYELVDLQGRIRQKGHTDKSISVSSLASGFYFARIRMADQWLLLRFVRQ